MTISATDILVPVCFKTPLLYLLTQKVAQKFGYVLGIKGKETYTLLYSLGTEELRIQKQGHKEENYQILKMRTMLHWLSLVLPNDEYIKNLSAWKQ